MPDQVLRPRGRRSRHGAPAASAKAGAAARLGAPIEAVAAFVANAPISVLMTDAELRFVKASPIWLKNFGLDEALLVGHTLYEMAPEFRDSFANLHRRCIAGETVSVEAERILTRSGQHHWIARDAGPW